MNDLVALLSRQFAADLGSLPARARRRFSAQRVERYGSIDELRAAARRGLPRVMFDFVDGAANDEVTATLNRRDFAALSIMPRVLVDVSSVDLSTTVLGEPVAVPLLGAPMGLNALVHHSGELAIARALHAAGSIYTLGAMASYSIEEIARDSPGPTWFQIYAWKDRGLVAELVARARAAGHLALVLTVDVPVAATRDRDRRNGFGLPPRATMRSIAGGIVRPRWSAQFIRNPRMRFASISTPDQPTSAPIHMTEYIGRQFDPSATWDELGWLREIWQGPLVVKGILRPEDARLAVSLGVNAISVSNHGGRQLDHAPSTIRALPAVVDAVAGEAEVYLDGGIRRGSDILKALALGARACLVGRPLVYGLGAGGAAGPARAMTILTSELRTAMALAGCPAVTSLDPSWVTEAELSTPTAAQGG